MPDELLAPSFLNREQRVIIFEQPESDMCLHNRSERGPKNSVCGGMKWSDLVSQHLYLRVCVSACVCVDLYTSNNEQVINVHTGYSTAMPSTFLFSFPLSAWMVFSGNQLWQMRLEQGGTAAVREKAFPDRL